MTGRLEVWLDGRHIGQFVFAQSAVAFEYDADASASPISLSLPRDRPARRNAALVFLENLLPEHPQTRARMAEAYGANSLSVFDLLRAAGGDVAGGLVLLPEGEAVTDTAASLSPALERDLAGRVASIKRDSADAIPRGVPSRFSLAGMQGKFALARVDDEWYWSNRAVPSTHIVKPGDPKLRGIEAAECAAIDLANRLGIPAPRPTVETFGDQTAYVVDRFDRARGPGVLAARIPAEDIVQSLGLSAEQKYRVTARQVLALLGDIDTGEELTQAFLDQLIFNVIVGNADAHAKNYSLLLLPDGPRFAPIYDVVPVFLYPDVSQRLAMKIGGASYSREVTMLHWRKLATSSGLDAEMLEGRIRAIAGGIGQFLDQAWNGLDSDQEAAARAFIGRNVERLLRG